MREAYYIIKDTIKENWRQALKEVLLCMGIVGLALFMFTFLMLAYNLPEPAPGIQSAEHRAVVAKHLGVSR